MAAIPLVIITLDLVVTPLVVSTIMKGKPFQFQFQAPCLHAIGLWRGLHPHKVLFASSYATTYVNCVGSPHNFFFEKGLTLQLSPYMCETPNGIVYAMMLSTTLKPYLLQYTPLANFPLLGGQRFVFGRDGL